MESLSRPFHPRKLSNATSFSSQNPYDVVFTKNRHKYSQPSPIDVQDYREIFGSSQVSSIPILDLSTLATQQGGDCLSFNFRDLKPDYSKIFGGFSDENVAVSYEELFGEDKTRVPASTAPATQDSDNLSHQSPDALKQFSLSYNKISPIFKDGLDGTKHVTQVPAVTGFTCFVDEPIMEAKKQNPSAANVKLSRNVARTESNRVESNFEDNKSKIFDTDLKRHPSMVNSSPSDVVNHKDDPKRSINSENSRNTVRKESNPVGATSEDKKARAFDNDLKRHPFMVSSSPSGIVNHKDVPKRSVKLESRKLDFDEEIDVNSAASALKQAIEKAQESIRIAKESVGRKKNGLRRFSEKKYKNSLKVEQKCRDEDSSQVFQEVGRNRKYRGTVLPDFMESEKLNVAKKFIDEIHEKMSESVKVSKFEDDTVASNATQVTSETEATPLDSVEKDEYATSCSETVETQASKIQTSDFVHEYQTDNKIVDEDEAGIEVSKPTIDILEHQSVVQELELEENDNEVLQESNQDANENRLDASQELLEDEKQENVLELEEVEDAESEKHEEIEEASVSVVSEDESKHDQNSEFHMDETSEVFGGFCDTDAKVSEQTCDDKLEESEATLHDDCEMKQEDARTVERNRECLDESCDQELDEKSSGDGNVIEETIDTDLVYVSSKNVERHNVNVETTQEVNDFAEVSCEFQAEETYICEETSIDKPTSDDNEDEYEVKSDERNVIDTLADLGSENDVGSESSSGSAHGEKIIGEESNAIDNLSDHGSENDVRSESSSGSTNGEKVTDEESNMQPPRKETPDTENTNEIKDSQEPESRRKEDEVEETGPTKTSGKYCFNKIDQEVAAKRSEWEKNRLAVDRAIREARERAFAEARERAERERAAVEKATEEVRQRMVAEAHEKVSKGSVTNKSSSENTFVRSKLRAERAAVERATAEARQRALEKAVSQKTASDLNRSESALRTKARLEKHNRIMERAAKALAEKEKRDRIAQKEQAERNRLAENLDADIKRWSNGKEGNLRALLSTLQYILGPESGWQPVTLTEIITTSAVKKAYRKATLCVHPDKLQQRGATIQQKYICEKVFDLLKAAWNRFNSEER